MSDIVQLHSAAEISDGVTTMTSAISRDYEGKDLTILGVLEDSFVFLADLLRNLKFPVHTAFLRYDHQSHGGIQDISFSADIDLMGLNILLVEGVLDTGIPQEYIIKHLGGRGAASVRLCVLIDKPDHRRVGLAPDYRLFETKELYVVGYGLGFNRRWRELPYLATISSIKEVG